MKTATTKFMQIYCGECKEAFDMIPDREWYNFIKKEYQHPIGFCSPECVRVYAARRNWK